MFSLYGVSVFSIFFSFSCDVVGSAATAAGVALDTPQCNGRVL